MLYEGKRQPLTVPALVSLSLPAADSHCSSLTWKRSHSCLSSDFTAPTFPQRFPTRRAKHRRRVCLQLAQMSLACSEYAERKRRTLVQQSWVRWVWRRVENVKNEPLLLCAIVCICTHCHSTVLRGTQVGWGGGSRGSEGGALCVSGLSYVHPSCPPGRQLCIVMYSSDILSCCLQAWAAFISMSSQPAVSWQLSLEPRGFYFQKFTANAAERDGQQGVPHCLAHPLVQL